MEGRIKKCLSFSFRVRLTMSFAKFGVDWSRNVGGVGKKQFCGFRDFAKKNSDANGRGLCQKMQQTPVNLCVQGFECGRFGVGVIAPNAYSLV